jgi:hypothetical protein
MADAQARLEMLQARTYILSLLIILGSYIGELGTDSFTLRHERNQETLSRPHLQVI